MYALVDNLSRNPISKPSGDEVNRTRFTAHNVYITTHEIKSHTVNIANM